MRRTVRAALSATLVAPALALGTGVSAAEPETPLANTQESLRTGFEKSDARRWTTLQEEHAFLRQLDRQSRRVVVSQVGTTIEGRPLQLVQVGHPRPAPPRRAARGSVIFFVCSQHGNEPAPREACLQLARDLAFTHNPVWVRLLRRTTVLFMTANPDGRAADTRGNAKGIDINRDYLRLQTPEARAITRVMNRWNPDVVEDMHEYGGDPEVYDAALTHLWPRNRNVDQQVYRQSKGLNNHYAAPEVEALGYDTGIYGLLYHNGEAFAQVSGDEQARKLRNYVGMRHSVGMLTESNVNPVTPREAQDKQTLRKRRVNVQYVASTGTLQFILERRRRIDHVTERAADRAAARGGTPQQVIYFAGQNHRLPTDPDNVDITPPCGYQLTADQYQSIERTLQLQQIEVDRQGDGYVVSMSQPSSYVIPLLLDDRGPHNVVSAEPLEKCSG